MRIFAWALGASLALGLLPARAQEGGRPFRLPPSPLMQALDTDRDGELSAKEIENAAAALKALDKDKDGKLSAEELRPTFAGPGGPGFGGQNPDVMVNAMMAFDKDKDGKLSKDELPDRMQSLMDRADTNKDGFIDRAELTALARQRSGRGPGNAPRGDGPDRKGQPRRPSSDTL